MKRYVIKMDIFSMLMIFIIFSCLWIFIGYILGRGDKICSQEVQDIRELLEQPKETYPINCHQLCMGMEYVEPCVSDCLKKNNVLHQLEMFESK